MIKDVNLIPKQNAHIESYLLTWETQYVRGLKIKKIRNNG